MAAVRSLPVFVVNVCLFAFVHSRSLEIPQRPSFAGSTGGTWENLVGQIIPPGTPWPAKAEDYYTTAKPILGDKLDNQTKEQTTLTSETKTPGTTTVLNNTKTTTEAYNISGSTKEPSEGSGSISLEYEPDRHSFAGASGGTLESYEGHTVPSGTPWPDREPGHSSSKPDGSSSFTDTKEVTESDTSTRYYTSSSSSFRPPTTISNVAHPPKANESNKSVDSNNTSPDNGDFKRPSIVLEYKPNRPPFAGITGGTWEGYLTNRSNTTTANQNPSPSVVLEYKPSRPSFAGSTGGTWESNVGQKVPSGTPWPEKATSGNDASLTFPTDEDSNDVVITNNSSVSNDSFKLPYLHIVLDVKDIKTAIVNDTRRLLIIDLNLNTKKSDSNDTDDVKKATEEFLLAEKDKSPTKNESKDTDPVLSIILDVDSFVKALRESKRVKVA